MEWATIRDSEIILSQCADSCSGRLGPGAQDRTPTRLAA
jgi:hypothetical protein